MNISPIPETELEHLVTPFFRHQTIENVPQSEIQSKPVMEVVEVVEIRFAGDKHYAPVMPITAMYRREGHKVITYAERFAEQYRAFLEGAPQLAEGTPLEMLEPYGISASQISLCRVLKIYSIESLYHLEGQNARNLGMSANALKDMAAAYMADRARGSEAAQEMDRMRREIAELRSQMAIPAAQPTPEQIAELLVASDDEFAAMDDAQLKAFIKEKSGAAPRGTPSRDFLINAARELKAA